MTKFSKLLLVVALMLGTFSIGHGVLKAQEPISGQSISALQRVIDQLTLLISRLSQNSSLSQVTSREGLEYPGEFIERLEELGILDPRTRVHDGTIPQLFALTPFVARPGGQLFVEGTNLSPGNNEVFVNEFSMGSFPSADNRVIPLVLPEGSNSGRFKLRVEASNGESQTKNFIIVNPNSSASPPRIIDFLPRFGDWSDVITVRGTGFDRFDNDIYTSLGVIEGKASPDGRTITFSLDELSFGNEAQTIFVRDKHLRERGSQILFFVANDNGAWESYNRAIYQIVEDEPSAPFVHDYSPHKGAWGSVIRVEGGNFTESNTIYTDAGPVFDVVSTDTRTLSFKLPDYSDREDPLAARREYVESYGNEIRFRIVNENSNGELFSGVFFLDVDNTDQ